jgi:carbon-monoxide dehydrogenase small subunit
MQNSPPLRLTVNGSQIEHSGAIEGRTRLADFLRDELKLFSVHLSCEQGVCGACTVLLDGRPVKSCLILAQQAESSSVITAEGLATDGKLDPLQEAFQDCHALQCGFCTPGMLLSARSLLDQTLAPTEDMIREAISGNLCRCTGYQPIVEAIQRAAQVLSDGRGGRN